MLVFISFTVEEETRENLSFQAFVEGRARQKILQELVDKYLKEHHGWMPIRDAAEKRKQMEVDWANPTMPPMREEES